MGDRARFSWCNGLNFGYLRVGESFIFVLLIDRLPGGTAHQLVTNDRTRSQIFHAIYQTGFAGDNITDQNVFEDFDMRIQTKHRKIFNGFFTFYIQSGFISRVVFI